VAVTLIACLRRDVYGSYMASYNPE